MAKTMKKSVLMMMAATVFAACSNHDTVFDPGAKEQALKAEYTQNFKSKYSNVNMNQDWDYSNKNAAYSLPSNSSASMAPRMRRAAASYNFSVTEEYEVDNNILTWMKGKLPEQKNNRAKGKPFYMKVPGNSFTIVPIYQGSASSVWELHAVIDGVDVKVWEKSQSIWVKKNNNADWQTVASLSNNELQKNTMDVATVKAQGYCFEGLPVGADMYLYLVVTKVNNSKYNRTIGQQMSSLNGMMLSLDDCPYPNNIEEGNQVMIIACEDTNVSSDNDMNDAVFMVYGKPYVPGVETIEEGTPITKKTTVRYMIEDLGATDDFDFNDIVIDVSDICTSTPKYVNGLLDSWTDSDFRQEAVIRHLGGTLPFKLTIGSTELPEHKGVLGANPDEKYTVTGWNKDTHNISVRVKQSGSETVYNTLGFPKAGEAPMIIAVEPTVDWMEERTSVPESWFIIPSE